MATINFNSFRTVRSNSATVEAQLNRKGVECFNQSGGWDLGDSKANEIRNNQGKNNNSGGKEMLPSNDRSKSLR